MNTLSLFILLLCSSSLVLSTNTNMPPSNILGSGGFDNGAVGTLTTARFNALNGIGGTLGRFNIWDYDYWNYDTNTPIIGSMDQGIIQAHAAGVTPVILFEYYPDMGAIGPYSKWYSIGRTYATRYAPNSAFLTQNGITNYGVTYYSTINEPEGSGLSTSGEYYALLGLADGVHSVSSSLAVVPGGFISPCAGSDYTLGGYGPVLAPLWNNGTLDGIDLHAYFDYVYAPMENTYRFSMQNMFDKVKQTSGITRDINFYSTEYNYKLLNPDWTQAQQAGMNEDTCARGILTAFWDGAGVVRNDGASGATQFALIWNIFNTDNSSDPNNNGPYGYQLSHKLVPSWVPNERGTTIQMTMGLIKGFTFTSRDPRGTGVYRLSNPDGRIMVVFQNRPDWSTINSASYTLTGIPTSTSCTVDLYRYTGHVSTTSLPAGTSSHTFTGLGTQETYMFIITPSKPPTPPPTPKPTPPPTPKPTPKPTPPPTPKPPTPKPPTPKPPTPAPTHRPASPSGSYITNTTGGSLVDSAGNVWTINLAVNGGAVAINGVADTNTWYVCEMAYVNGIMWQENNNLLWWGKSSPTAAWSPASGTSVNPRASPNDSAIMSVANGGHTTDELINNDGDVWTIDGTHNGGAVAINGAYDSSTWNVQELAYVSGNIWQKNDQGLWWYKSNKNAAWLPTAGTKTSPL